MKHISKILFFSVLLLFTACGSKNKVKINEEMNSFHLDKNISIYKAAQTVPSAFSIGLGMGGNISSNVGVGVGTVIRPNVRNSEALDIERSIFVHNISLENIVKEEFSTAMQNDVYYKNKYVAFGSDYKVRLLIPKYIIENSIFSSNENVKVYLDARIINKNGNIIYSESFVNKSKDYPQNSILNDKKNLEDALRNSIQKSIFQLIFKMKKN